MEKNKGKSLEMLNRAKISMPGGVSSPVRALKAVGGEPLFVNKALGALIFDLDENSYIDLCMSFGPLILGHANDHIINSIVESAKLGTSFGTSSPGEVELAEKIIKAHSAADWVRFVNSGTEAVMSALRLARGYTGRDMIIKFSGCYHGHADSMLVKAGSGLVTFGISSSQGVPADTTKNTIVLELGDINQVREAFEKFGDKIAALIIEGIPANNGLLIQSEVYMKQLQKIVHSNGSLLVLDEVITGFRLGMGGATKYYGIKPDIVTFGKIIGGGLPVGAYAGRKELMDLISPLGPVYQAGTLSGNPLAMAAGNTALSILSKNDIHKKLEKLSEDLCKRLINSFGEYSIPLTIRRIGSILWPILQNNVTPVNPDDISELAVNAYSNFHGNALKEGVYLPPSAYEVAFLSTSHEDHIDDIVDKLVRAGRKL
ncbi:MAG: glutamate-1-semialdehyde 2,1-aminomutase [Candidatus Heimdallarchaeota archaeon]|nr:glutamate-1-semialdehyde 2,1-aminomutase [Candidatus Heimdallarchaeota archaeon]